MLKTVEISLNLKVQVLKYKIVFLYVNVWGNFVCIILPLDTILMRRTFCRDIRASVRIYTVIAGWWS